MPELPEVETIRLDLNKSILNRETSKIELLNRKSSKNPAQEFKEILEGNCIQAIERKGKLLICKLKSNHLMLIHLRMTGQIILSKKGETSRGGYSRSSKESTLPNKHSRIIIHFAKGNVIYFNDIRKFGYFEIVKANELPHKLKNYGTDPFEKNYTLKTLSEIAKKSSTNLKAFLLNQKHIAGTGNIYADEICFKLGLHPSTKTSGLNEKQLNALHKATIQILSEAINNRGTSFSDYRDAKGQKGNFQNLLKVYGRNKQACLKCKKSLIGKTKLAGRGTHFCPNCQK